MSKFEDALKNEAAMTDPSPKLDGEASIRKFKDEISRHNQGRSVEFDPEREMFKQERRTLLTTVTKARENELDTFLRERGAEHYGVTDEFSTEGMSFFEDTEINSYHANVYLVDAEKRDLIVKEASEAFPENWIYKDPKATVYEDFLDGLDDDKSQEVTK